MSHDPDTGEVINFDFAEFLADFGGGEANALISQRMAQLNAEVERVGDKGLIAISFEVDRNKHGTAKVTLKSCRTKLPTEPVQGEVFYHAEGGGLSRVAQEPPRQPGFNFSNVTPLDKDRKAN